MSRGCCKPFRAAVGLGVAGLACLVFGVVMIVMLPSILRAQVIKNVKLEPNSMTFNLWKEIPVPFFMSIYFFEVVNPNDILKGAKPVVRQRGPYVYSERRYKDNITFHDNGTVSFLGWRELFFHPDKSNGSESDYVVVPNILVMGAAMMLEDMPLALKLTVSSAFAFFKHKAFMNRTVEDILWGYEDPLIDFLDKIKPGLFPGKGKFGLFTELNNSNSGLFTVYSGMDNVTETQMVDNWNGLKKVSYWNSEQCNMINGTAGEMWPPFLTPSSPVEFYSPDACRSMKLDFVQTGEFKGIPSYRYHAPKTMFANGTDYPPNEGFCPCRQSGIQNVSACRSNAPLFISNPHFLYGDPALLDTVDGLHPNEEEHRLFLDLNPLTGVPLNCAIKMQLNLFIKQVPGILQTGTIKPVVLPLLWFSESGQIEGHILDEFYTNLVLIPSLIEYGQYILVALGGVLLITSALLGLKSKRDTTAKTSRRPNLQDDASETSPLLQEGSSTVDHGHVSKT
ncbi:scavenger receptor class B member 1 isoform X2 [Elgaria multicarinata webbii]|uniref:scavenger receptor class B member 1 isoform X2 n=1 Tax=Elgaria multicarinata webbii TaxID=159646 RepID=UPI002FCD0236